MLGLSMQEVAKSLGVSFQQVHKYEQASTRIPAGRLQHLATVLDVPVGFFFENAPTEERSAFLVSSQKTFTASYIRDFLASTDGLLLAKSFMRIEPARLRRSIVLLVERLAGKRLPLMKR